MTAVLLHHGLLAALASLAFGAALWGAQRAVAARQRIALGPLRPLGAVGVAAAAFLAAALACGLYLASQTVREASDLQALLVATAVLAPLLAAWRALDRRLTSLPLALACLASATVVLAVLPTGNLARYLLLAVAGFAGLLRVPPPSRADAPRRLRAERLSPRRLRVESRDLVIGRPREGEPPE